MNSENLQNLFKQNWNLLLQALPSFERSLAKCRQFEISRPISFEVEESMDAMSSKFARVSDIYTQKVIKSLLFILRENAPTFIDRIYLCEKLEIISSAEEMIAVRDLPIRTHSSIPNDIQVCVSVSGVSPESLACYYHKRGDIDLLLPTLEKILSTLIHCVQRLVFNENYQRKSS